MSVRESVDVMPDVEFGGWRDCRICFSTIYLISVFQLYSIYLNFRYSAMQPRPDPLITAAQLGSVLQATRKAQGLTQAALASRIGLSQSRVSHLELNAQELSVEQLLAWCSALGLELAVGVRGRSVASAAAQAEW
jgi:HTH-type transcriptional regulator/antitoxin HipB